MRYTFSNMNTNLLPKLLFKKKKFHAQIIYEKFREKKIDRQFQITEHARNYNKVKFILIF